MTTWGRSSRWSLLLPWVRNPLSRTRSVTGAPGRTGPEVGGGRVEEQQVDFQVEQVRDLVVDLFGEDLLDVQQRVHRPVTRVVAHIGQSSDVHVMGDPVGRGQL